MKPLVIVPTYNEVENIERLLEKVLDVSPEIEVLVVDDSSPDGTGELVEEITGEENRVHLIRRSQKMGLGSAYITGFRWSLKRDYDPVFEMDGDLSHNPACLPDFLEAVKEADLVVGSRLVRGGGVNNWSFSRKLLSRFGNEYVRFLTGLPVRDATSGFRCLRKGALSALNLSGIRSEGYAFQIETVFRLWKKGFRVKEIPIVFEGRRRGKSKMSADIVIEGLLLPWILRFKKVS